MSTHFSRFCAIVVAGALLFMGGGAWAQQAPAAGAAQQPQQPQGPIAADLVAVQPDWTKVCGSDPQTKKEMCYTTRDFGVSAKEGEAPQPLLALAVYDPKSDDQKIIRLLLPPGLMLKPGFRFAIDKGTPESGAFEICFPNGCFAEAKVKKAVIDGMKKAEKMSVVVKNSGEQRGHLLSAARQFRQSLRRSRDRPQGARGAAEEAPGRIAEEGRRGAQEARGSKGRRAGRAEEIGWD